MGTLSGRGDLSKHRQYRSARLPQNPLPQEPRAIPFPLRTRILKSPSLGLTPIGHDQSASAAQNGPKRPRNKGFRTMAPLIRPIHRFERTRKNPQNMHDIPPVFPRPFESSLCQSSGTLASNPLISQPLRGLQRSTRGVRLEVPTARMLLEDDVRHVRC
jgi:hypothetical protein